MLQTLLLWGSESTKCPYNIERGNISMLRILGRNTSSNVMKVLWVCDELGVEYKREDIGGKYGKNDHPDYLEMNPNGLVPTVIDDDFVLWESNAIIRYIAHKYDHEEKIWPKDPKSRAESDRWMEWLSTSVNPPMFLIFRNLVRESDETRNMKEVEIGTKKAVKLWRILDTHLANKKFVGGSKFTLGDVPLGVHVRRWIALRPEEANSMLNLLTWFERLKKRAAYQHCLIPLQ